MSSLTDSHLLFRSRYACFGLWIIDLRSLYPPLQTLLGSSPDRPSLGPLKSYPTLTELTRNPPSTRAAIEKNWLLFFPSSGEAYIQYELPSHITKSSASTSDNKSTPTRGRTFAKLLGNGLTTTNLTDPLEQPCLNELTALYDNDAAGKPRRGTWHQATNSLRLVLCERADPNCQPTSSNTVFFALIHRKFPNELKLPLRYERFFLVWAATPPFGMLGISKHPILLYNETASGWTAGQNWADDDVEAKAVSFTDNPGLVPGKRAVRNETIPTLAADDSSTEKPLWAYFTYTVSIAYGWGRPPKAKRHGHIGNGDEAEDMHVGYLDDEVVLGIGVDDAGQAFARVRAGDLVSCMQACPGRTEVRREKGRERETKL